MYRPEQQENTINNSDDNYIASWDKSDYSYVKKIFNKIAQCKQDLRTALQNRDREGFRYARVKTTQEVSRFVNMIERKYNDQLVYDENLNRYIEIQKVGHQKDIVTKDGMETFAALIVGETFTYFNYFASGTGSTPASVNDTRLVAENARVFMPTDGFANSIGSTIRYGGIFAPPIPSATITEIGVFNAETGGLIGVRSVFGPNETISHVQNQDFYTANTSIFQNSV